jgi:hypothetical protein
MRVDPKDLIDKFQGSGEAFENFVHDLVRAVGRSCGIDPVNIHWDFRTNVKDGGRDLLIKIGNPQAATQSLNQHFIPARPSVWSLKSGEAGVKPASLKEEIRDKNHPKVRDALKKGSVYVWCTVQPANQDKRDEMCEAANEIANELRVDPGLIEFRWIEHLEGEVNLHPNLIAIHLPNIACSLANVFSLREWRRERGMSHPWVDFNARDDVVQRVAKHLLGREPPNVFHIAGLSGIGKTRTVFEACYREPELNGIFYVERFEQVSRELHRYLEVDRRQVYLVIDETSFDQMDRLRVQLSEFAERVRVVTIGPAVRQAAISQDNILILPEPETEAGVLEVVRAGGPELPDDVLRSIASQSGHDLRLAMLLVEASKRLPEFRGILIVNIDDVWKRLMGLFAHEIGDPHKFRCFYELLTTSIDIGMADDVAGEIEALAKHFEHPVEHFRATVSTSVRCGLGIRTQKFFEAAPRALASRLFSDRVWPRIKDNLEVFFQRLPERLGRRFLERCHDCTGLVREEVMARLGNFFLNSLSGEDVLVLASRESSRLFQTWAEFDPGRGLGWLRGVVNRATPEQLRALDGKPDASGGWRGRRQLVWLCQNLASFGEHFDACEAILFRLALYETEPEIGNNSTVIWKSLFWPALAGTEMPFDRRLPILVRRLRGTTSEELPLILGAAVGCVQHHYLGVPTPPRVVGGRVVPSPWMPDDWNELGAMRRDAARQILDAIAGLDDALTFEALRAVVKHLELFTGLGLLERLRTLLRPDRVDESLRRRLVAKLEEQTTFLRNADEETHSDPTLGPLEEWLAELSPPDLATQVRDLTAQAYWTGWAPEERDARYNRLADGLIASPATFRQLAGWFATAESQSAGWLGIRVGQRDRGGELAEVVRDWLRADSCRLVTVGYLNGIAVRDGGLPEEWAATLQALAADRPELAAIAMASADVSSRGFDQLLELLDRLPAPASRFLRPLAYGNWLQVVSPQQRVRAAEALIHLADAGDPEAVNVGLDLILMWAHVASIAIDQALARLALNLARQPVSAVSRRDLSNWEKVLRLVCPFFPREVAELVVRYITEPGGAGGWRQAESVDLLAAAAAIDPSAVMEAVGSAITDRARRAIFGIGVFQGLFDAIGLQHVRAWVENHGGKHLPLLARHFLSPNLDKAGQPVVPPLAEWLFREHETDEKAFHGFLMGRYSGKITSEAETDPARKRQEMQPFLKHELRRVQEWAKYEIEKEEWHAAHFKEMDEEDDRR